MTQDLSNTTSPQDSPRRVVDFFTLPRPVQDRVVASLTGHGVPAVLAFAANPAWRVQRWAWLAVLLFAALVGLGSVGFGQLGSPNALHAGTFLVAYVLVGVLFCLALTVFLMAGRPSDYPFALGTYLLPVGVIEVNRRRLVITSIAELQRVEAEGARLRVVFGSGVFRFPMPSGGDVTALRSELEGYRSQWIAAFRAGDRRTLAGLDPVRDSGFSNPLSSRATIPRVRTRATPRVILGVAIGAVTGLAFFYGRNALAERSIYRKAVTLNTEQAYRAYLANGGKRSDVTEWRLPQAELIAVSGNLAAIEKYAREHTDSKIREDIEKLLRLELLEELRRVRTSADLTALDSFKETHPDHALVAEELASVRHAVFRAAYEAFEKKYAPNKAASAFISDLITHAEHNGPDIDVRIRRELPPSMDRADSAIRKSSYFTGQKAVPSQYFRGEAAEAREAVVTKALADALQSAFPTSILHFVTNRGEEGAGPEPSVQRPTLLISYKTEMSGGYTTNRPRGVYVGLGMMFQFAGLVPGVKEPFRFKDSAWLPPDINEISKNLLRPEQVYEANAAEGFERFLNGLLGRLFGERGGPRISLKKANSEGSAPAAAQQELPNHGE